MTLALTPVDGIPILLQPGYDYDLNDDSRRSYQEIYDLNAKDKSALGVQTVTEAAPASSDKRVTAKTLDMIEGVPTLVNSVEDYPLSERKEAMLTSLADTRWQREVGGVPFGMGSVASDDRSKLLIFAAYTKALSDSNYTKTWKLAPGQYATLDAATLVALGEALEQHVSACFAREAELATAIVAAESHAILDNIASTLLTAWPENA